MTHRTVGTPVCVRFRAFDEQARGGVSNKKISENRPILNDIPLLKMSSAQLIPIFNSNIKFK